MMPAQNDSEQLTQTHATDTPQVPADLTESFEPVDSATAALYPALDVQTLDMWQKAETARIQAQKADSIAAVQALPPEWTKGLEPEPLSPNGATDSALMALIVAVLVSVTLSLRVSRRIFSNIGKDLVSLRNRQKDFDERNGTEERVMILYIAQCVIYLGIILNMGHDAHHGITILSGGFFTTLKFIGLAAAYYLFRLSAYTAVGYTFTTADLRGQLVRGYNAEQAVLGFELLIPTLFSVFYPDALPVMLGVAACCCVVTRILFVIKGFRIFYDKFDAWLYFILYLCTLEIVPAVLLIFLTGNI